MSTGTDLSTVLRFREYEVKRGPCTNDVIGEGGGGGGGGVAKNCPFHLIFMEPVNRTSACP